MAWTEALHPALSRPLVLSMAAVEWAATRVVFDPTSDAYFEDPYTMYRRLRERSPVHRSWAAGGWVLSRHADVLAVLRDRRFSADERHYFLFDRIWRRRAPLREDLDAEYRPLMLRQDGEDHARLRGLVSKAFTPRAVEKLRGRIENIVAGLLDEAAERGRVDLMRDLATPLPVTVIAEMLGVPAADLSLFKGWSEKVVQVLGVASDEQVRAAARAERELSEYLAALAAERRRAPADDLLTGLVQVEEQGDRLSMGDLLRTCVLLLVAGNETTTNLVGNGTHALLRHPGQLALLRERPGRIEAAVEELLRFDSPVQLTSRFPTEDVEFGGAQFRRGQQVVLLLGAANRDPERFPEPDRLDLERNAEGQLSFGHGAHYCLGAQLARLEGSAALGQLVRRFPRLRPDGPVRWRPHTLLRGLETLPVALA